LGEPRDDPFDKTVFVLTSNTFQKWYLSQGDPERLVYSCDLESIAKRDFATNTWVSLSYTRDYIMHRQWINIKFGVNVKFVN
jgi:hypothetical protein